MSATIQRRVEALESAGVAGIDFILIIRRIVTPGMALGEVWRASLQGLQFERHRSESESDFIERLRTHAQSQRRPGQLAAQVLVEEIDLDL